MARPLRIEFPGAFYHVIQRGTEKKEIFLSSKDFERFFGYISSASIKYDILIHTYCIMRNHYHLIVETKKANLSKVMHYINSSYTTYFNIKTKRTGPLYQGRYKAILVQQDEYLHHLSSYIHLNPVRAHIVEHPGGYPYSSYRYFTANLKPPAWLNINLILSMFDKSIPKARALYKDFVLSDIGKEKTVIKENIIHGLLLGNEQYLHWIQDTFLKERNDDKEMPLLRKLKPRPKPDQIIKYVESEIRNERLAKKFSIYLIRKYSDLTLKDIATMFNNLGYTGVSKIYKRTEEQMSRNREIKETIGRLENEIMSNVKT